MPSFLIECSSFLQVMMTTINSLLSLKFGQIRPLTEELDKYRILGAMQEICHQYAFKVKQVKNRNALFS